MVCALRSTRGNDGLIKMLFCENGMGKEGNSTY